MNRLTRAFALAAIAALAVPTLRADDAWTVTATMQRRAVFSCADFTFSDGSVDSLGISNNVIGSNGDVASNGNIKMSGGATVHGDATAGPGKTVSNSGSSRVTGTKSSATALENCTPVDLAALVNAVQATNDDGKIPLTGQKKNPLGGATHFEFTLSGGDTLTLPPGTYYFTKFTVSGGSTITLTGPTRILCSGKVDISGGSFVNPQPYNFRFWVSGAGPYTLSGGSTMAGFIYAPSAPSTISSSRLIGGIFASQVTVSGTTAHVSRAIDDVGPRVSITQPADGAVVSDPAHVLVKGTAGDDQSPVTVTVNGQAAPVAADGTFQITLNLSNASPATIAAVATDLAGNSNSARVTVTTVPPPVLTLSSPAPGSWVKTRLVDLTGGAGNATTVTVNGQSAVVSNGGWSLAGFDLGADGAHTLTITGTSVGGPATITPVLNLDTVAPVIHAAATPAANAAGWNNSDVTVSFTCSDAGGSGVPHCPDPVTVTSEGTGLTVTRSAVDLAGNETPVTVTLNIDKTAPKPTITAPADAAVVIDPHLAITGAADDAVTITVNGAAATIDPVTATYTSAPLSLVEGSNTIAVNATDRAGNSGTASATVTLDSRAPQIAIATPAAEACLNATDVVVSGTVSDPNLQGVTVQGPAGTVNATVNGSAWSAAFANVAEGRQVFTVTASDTLGHSAVAAVAINIDRTAPVINVTDGGAPFTATLVNRPVALLVRVDDAGGNVTMTATLDGAPYVSGTAISAEGAHTLAVTASDCAGLSAQKTLQFTVDRTAPSLTNLAPAPGLTVGSVPVAITGTASEAATISIAGTNFFASTDASKKFALPGSVLAEGVNALTLHAVDAAGNAADVPYTVTVKSGAPSIEILENGSPIAAGSIYNRAITPQVRVSPTDATVTAKLGGQPFTLGSAISADGAYNLSVTATDLLGHSAGAAVSFSIDTHAPAVKIDAPANGAVINTAQTTVTGDAGDSVAVTVNGIAATVAANRFSAVVPLEAGENEIVATGRDTAGNRGSDRVVVTRGQADSGLVITYPPDTLLTNRKTTLVTGRVLTPSDLATLTIESKAGAQTTGALAVKADASGAFTVPDLPLFEGADTITVTSTSKSGSVTAAAVHLTVDLTPPAVTILAGADPLEEGKRYPSAIMVSVSATDASSIASTSLQIDGATVAAPFTVSASGGHTAVAVAADGAKNETRVTRTFFVGGEGSAACALANFDPADGAVVTANSVTLVGSSGGAASVTVNGVPASVANGMFRATVELPLEGANNVAIACEGTNKTIVLQRVTAAPSITIDTPAEMSPTASETITVTGTVSGATSVDVNGTPAVVSSNTWTASNVRLAAGLNILAAHATSAAGRIAVATRRVVYLKNAPAISISSPAAGFVTGAAAVDITGTYANVDPLTIAISGGTLVPQQPYSDTTGSFVLRNAPLATGAQTLTVTAHDALNRTVSAPVDVTRTAGAPSIVITAPADNSWLSTTAPVPVTGTFTAADGSRIDINSSAATLSGGAFSGSVTLAGSGVTPIAARLTQPDNASAVATVLVNSLQSAPSVRLTFPAADAVGVDAGVIVLVSFSAPMEKTSLQSAFSLVNAAGAPVSGQFRLDKDVLSFAPAAALNPGERYTMHVTTAAKDLAGSALDKELVSSFTVAASAGSAPQVTAITQPVCGTSVTISGTVPAGAQVRIDYAGATLFTTASSTSAFSQLLGISSQSGYYVARVRVVGADGSLSPAAEVPFTVDCAGPAVVGATYDRTANLVTINFSKPIDFTSISVGAAGSIQLTLADGTPVAGTAAQGSSSSVVAVTPGPPDPRGVTLVLLVTTGVKDTSGRNLAASFPQTFTVGGDAQGASGGNGFVSGQIIDAGTGRSLGAAHVVIGTAPTTSRANGSYSMALPEGAYTIHAYADGYTDVWRQVVVRAGQGVVPIDIRLTGRGTSANHGGDSTLTRRASLNIASGAIPPGATATVTAVGAQGLAGLLPLGWSPLAAAEVRVSGDVPASSGTLTFQIPGAQVAASGKALTAVVYDATRDVWRVVQPAVATSGDSAQVTFSLASIADVALVYPDSGTGVTAPPAPVSGGVLAGVDDNCATGCPAMHPKQPFDLNPAIVTATGSTVATLSIDVAGNAFPSGTAVDALVNEELTLVGGSVLTDVPYSADLVLYRNLAGDAAVADFKLTPSTTAANVQLQIGFDHIQIVPYPGRLDRGTLLGPSGGRIPSDGTVQVDVPSGATSIALHASAHAISDLSPFRPIDGFDVVAGFTVALDPSDTTQPFTQLVKPATATVVLDPSVLGASPQLILAEVLPSTPYGRMFRLADRMDAPRPIDNTTKVSVATSPVDVAVLPVDGIVRAGQYLVLRATSPIAFAFGGVRFEGGAYIPGAAVTAFSLGVRDVARAGGIFALPVVAKPAAPFTLVPSHPNFGQGVAYVAGAAPDANQIVAVGDLLFKQQAPTLDHVYVTGAQQVDLLANNGAGEISLSTGVQAVFSQSINLSSVSNSSIVVTDTATGKVVPGSVVAGATAVSWTPTPVPTGQPLAPNSTYVVTIAGTIQGAFGAPLGASATYAFSTITQLANAQIHAERIRITIPDANGVSTISGEAGALPTAPPEPKAWRAIATRRGNAFVTQYQVTANGDGSFSFTIGNCGGTVKCGDAVDIHDHIDLEILNAADNVAAILPLTPFVTADGQGFIAPTDVPTEFVAKDGVGVHVPTGAFDQPTIVRVAHLDNDAPFAAVPSIHDEMTFYAGVNLTFDCTAGGGTADASAPAECKANKRLDVSIPVRGTLDPAGHNFVLGWLGDSVRGPRMMIVDTLRVENGSFTTADATTSGQNVTRKTTTLATAPRAATVRKSSPTATTTIDAFTATPGSILTGETSQLHWQTSNASTVTLEDMSVTPPATLATTASGDLAVAPSATTDYRLTATGSGGTVTGTVTVTVTPPPTINSFTASPISILPGQSSTLHWSTSNASSVQVTNVATGEVLSGATSGTAAVSPSQTTNYRLTATGSGATVTQEVTVALNPPAYSGVLTGADIKRALMGVLRQGMYDVGELHSPIGGGIGWTSMDGLQGNYDLFSSRWNSLFLSHVYLNEAHGRPIMPAILGKPFEIVGFDAGTGLQAFSKLYDPLPDTGNGAAYIVPPPANDDNGPYPVLGSPLRVDVVDVLAEDVDITSVPNFIIKLKSGIIKVDKDTADPLLSTIKVQVFNASSGAKDNLDTDAPFAVSGKVGDRLIIVRGAEDVDPNAELSLVFNKPIFTGPDTGDDQIDQWLHVNKIIKLEKAPKPPAGTPPLPPVYSDISDMARYTVDSGNLRLKIVLPSSMERGAFYRITISPKLADQKTTPTGPAPGLMIGQITLPSGSPAGSIAAPGMAVEFQVREVPDALTAFNIRQEPGVAPNGSVKDLALNGNTLFVAALDGGILAYDVANPASMTSNTVPVGRVDPGPNQFWSIASDEHGRVYATALGPTFGFIQAYHLDDFYAPCAGTAEDPCPVKHVKPRAATVVSWAPGYGSGIDADSDTTLSDRPEGIPRKLQIAVQDSELRFDSHTDFINNLTTKLATVSSTGGVGTQTDIGSFKKLSVSIGKQSTNEYRLQRITVENITRDMRWSADAIDASQATIDNIVAEEGDQLRVVFNERTYGVVSIFGYGVGVFDLNAVEANDLPTTPPPNTKTWSERVRLTSAGTGQACTVAAIDDVIPDLTLSGEASLIPSATTPDFRVFGLDIHRGVLDLRINPPAPPPPGTPPSILPADCDDRSPVGLRLTPANSPRINALKNAYMSASGGKIPSGRFAAIQTYHWILEAQDNKALPPAPGTTPAMSTTPPPGARGSVAGTRVVRDYLLVPANQYGLLILDATKPAGWLGQGSLADIIWVPAGVVSARVIPRTHLAIAVDADGRILLIDLAHIDQRWDEHGVLVPNDALFKTALTALGMPSPVDEDGPYGVGAPDPRIVWTSKKHVVSGNVVPVIDSDTGMVFAGKLLLDLPTDANMRVIPAIDPRVEIRADLGKGGLAEVGGVVPLGVEPPPGVLNAADPNASLGAFRLRLSLPGAVADAITGSSLRLAVESERVAGAPVEQTPEPFPRAHFRAKTPSGNAESRTAPAFVFTRDIPTGMEAVLRRQRGFNHFLSPWIVAIADPRASEKFVGTSQQKKDAGCVSCDRPDRLKNKLESDGVYELWSGGRLLSVRPEITSGTDTIFTGTPYAYLGKNHRLDAHFAMVPGRPIHPKEALVPAQNPPVAAGMLQETTYVHSGEVEVNDVDLDAGGRAGVDVVFARRHRSRTLGTLFLGEGWDAPMFRFIIPLPNGKVEYHDGAGEVWTYEKDASGVYQAPGLFLKLVPIDNGWDLIDQKWRTTRFDSFGRLASESDEFATGTDLSKGNTILYLYDTQGRLATIVDPVNRQTTLTYWKESEASTTGAYVGRLKEIKDWRERAIDFEYDAAGRLIKVKQPQVTSSVTSSLVFTGNPETRYTYEAPTAPAADAPPQSQQWTDFVEFFGNIKTISDPVQVAANSSTPNARVTFTYDLSTAPLKRDRETQQKWLTGETPVFDYPSATKTTSTDALAQAREYELTSATDNDKRVHVKTLTEKDVPILTLPDPLPAAAAVSLTATPQPLVTTYGYNEHGQIASLTAPDGRLDQPTIDAASAPVGTIVKKITTTAPSLPQTETHFEYDTAANSVNTVVKIGRKDPVTTSTTTSSTNAVFRDAQQPSRERTETKRTDDGSSAATPIGPTITGSTKWNPDGQVNSVKVSDGTNTTRARAYFYYGVPSLNLHERGRTFHITSTTNDLVQTFTYDKEGDGEKMVATDDVRKITTETHTDELDRLVHRIIKDASNAVVTDESFGYDASGRLSVHRRVQEGVGTVEETFSYDAMGRPTATTSDNAQVNGSGATVRTKTTYDMASRQVIAYDPYVGSEKIKTTALFDGLGRTIRTDRQAASGGDVIRFTRAYDIHGQLAYESDGFHLATLRQFDALGRELKSIHSDGTSVESKWDAWGQVIEQISRDSANNEIAHVKNFYTYAGRMLVSNEREYGSAAVARQTFYSLDAGVTKTSVRTGEVANLDALSNPTGVYRVAQTEKDIVGRVTFETAGEALGNQPDIDNVKAFSRTKYDYLGTLPSLVTSLEPKVGTSYSTTPVYDGLYRLSTVEAPGGYTTDTHFDEAGNPLRVKRPGLAEETTNFDSRGLAAMRTLPDGKTQQLQYDERALLHQYTDEEGKITNYTPDALGRMKTVEYVGDSTSETTEYEPGTNLVRARRDRAGQWLSYLYDAGGRVTEVHDGQNPTTTPTLMVYEYDAAGRLTLVRNKDAGIEYADYDLLGRPHTTRSYRYSGGSGAGSSPTIAETHTQRHEWSVFDERTSWTMPAAGSTVPPDDPTSPWLQTIVETRDAGSNLTDQTTSGGASLAHSETRSAGRISLRTLPPSISTTFGFADGAPPSGIELPPVVAATSSASGLPLWNLTEASGSRRAGSANSRDASARLHGVRDLSTDRFSLWSYDARSRLADGVLGAADPADARTVDTLTAADFRRKRDTPPLLTAAQHTLLGTAASLAFEPQSWTASQNDAHQIGDRTLYLDGTAQGTRNYGFTGGRRTTDGPWTYTFDPFGRLATATNTTAGRQIVYEWDPNDRISGRTANQSDGTGGWSVETRGDILAADGLPAETTFVWDPIVDRLVTIFAKGGGPVRQYLHGDQGYDDPIEVRAAVAPGFPPNRYIPVLDHAGAGSLMAVLGNNGDVVERVLYADSYGDAPRYLEGPVVDKITFQATKNSSGNIETVKVRVHLDERIVASSVAGALRLAAVTSDHSVIYAVGTDPTVDDAHTLLWTLAGSDWSLLTNASGAQSLEVAVKDGLRCEGWGSSPVQPVPSWALRLYSGTETSTQTPVVVRESFGSLSTFLGTIADSGTREKMLYSIPNLYLAGVEQSKTKLFTGFGALPFADPATGLVYARARWFDPQTGSFLSADPAGYRDSSNLYAYCGGDPVNCKDSTGLFGWRDVADFAWGLGSLASSPKEQLKTVGRTAASVAGFVVSFVPGASQVIHETPQNIRRIRQAVAAYRQGGVSGVLQYNREEGERIAASQPPIGDVVLNALPVVGTIRQAMTIPDTYYREGPFFGGMAVGNTTQRAAADATLIYGAAKALDPGPLLVFKAPRTAASPAPLLLAPSKMSNPWLGAPTYAGPAPLGMEIEMAMAPGQINPGEFGTLDTIPDMAYVRGDLAVIPSFKPVISHVQRFQVPAGVQIQTGIVGPQVEGGIVYPGGATQVQILNFADRARLIPIGAPRPLPAPGAPVLP
jgi:RHS repeat-associated protein